jgi:hypothetical protein
MGMAAYQHNYSDFNHMPVLAIAARAKQEKYRPILDILVYLATQSETA